MKYLNGSEIAGFIKERQAKQVRSLSQAKGINLQLNIISCGDNLANKKYTSIKQKYGEDIGAEVIVHECTQTEAVNLIEKLDQYQYTIDKGKVHYTFYAVSNIKKYVLLQDNLILIYHLLHSQ